MGKKSKSAREAAAASGAAEVVAKGDAGGSGGLSFLTGGATIDSGLASLFDMSAGPVQAPQYTAQNLSVTRTRELKNKKGARAQEDGEEELSSIATDEGSGEDEEMVDADEEEEDAAIAAREVVQAPLSKGQNRKRKRGERGDDLEASYMRRMEKEEDREHKKRSEEDAKRRKVVKPTNGEGDDEEEGEEEEEEENSADEAEESSDENISPPAHESLTPQSAEAAAMEKSARTVFLGNVSSEAIKSKSAKKTLLAHLSSFFPALAETSKVAPKIDSIRFRSTAFSTTAMPKRAAYAKREVMDATTRSTNAYVVYNTVPAARKALNLNGSIILDRHLRVDSVAHPAKQDHKRCVFVGNLGFVDEETAENDDEGNKKKKQKEPADSEEGLWRTFNEHVKIASSKDPKGKNNSTDDGNTNKAKGVVESVRVVRDSATRVSKGFAYVQFYDENAVEAALLLNEKKFPPLLPRKLRVTRAKRVTTKPNASGPMSKGNTRMDERQASMAGRAGKLFGRAGAAKFQKDPSGRFNKGGRSATGSNASALGAAGDGEKMVFEGFRASEKNGKFNLKTKSRGAKASGGGKPKTKSAKRAKAWKEKKGV